eukprot:m51a1_g9342 hypothetical protein (171) ;mRNA; f:70010-70522
MRALLLASFVAGLAAAGALLEGDTCNGFAGAIFGACGPGLECVAPAGSADLGVCQKKILGTGDACVSAGGEPLGACGLGLECRRGEDGASWCQKKQLGWGETCSGVAGLFVGECSYGLECAARGSDNGVCQWKVLGRGRTCADATGQVGVCRAPLVCRPAGAGISVCARA